MRNIEKPNRVCKNTVIGDIDTNVLNIFKTSNESKLSVPLLIKVLPMYTKLEIKESLKRLDQYGFINTIGGGYYTLRKRNKRSPYYQNQTNEGYILHILKHHPSGLTKVGLQSQVEILKQSPLSEYHFNKAIRFLKEHNYPLLIEKQGNKNIYKHKTPCV